MAKIAFDIDDTLYKVIYKLDPHTLLMVPYGQVPDYDIIDLLVSLYKLGNKIYLWSAGGLEYTINFAQKFGIIDMVIPIEKSKESAKMFGIDVTFDDQEVTLGKVNIRIPREIHEEE